ncbi:MAG: erythromycin esterase family protein [Eubacterium sp.]|nr:erythromycin esterase family protein [Eubacterium sp.]
MNRKNIIILAIAAAVVVAGIAGFVLKKPGKIEGFENAVTTVDKIEIPEGTRIVALGEATHGNKEFQELKLEVLQTLVEKSKVRALILEGDFGGCALANKYIQGGDGTAEEVTRKLGYRIYRTDEMCALVQWMHDYNMTAEESQKVRLYGMDIQSDIWNIQLIKELYQELDEAKCKDYSDRMDTYLGTEDDAYNPAEYDNIISLMDEIGADIESNKDAYVAKVGQAMVETGEQATVAIKCYMELLEKQNYSNKFRDTKMKEFVDWTLEIEEREYKSELMLASHNGHMTQQYSSPATFLGKYLNDEYGDAYFAIGTDFYYTKDNVPGKDGRMVAEICSKDKLAYQVKYMDEDKVYIDFGKVDPNSKLGKIVNKRMWMGSVGEGYNFLTKILKTAHSINYVPSDIYDAMIVYYEVNPIEIWEKQD